MKALRWHARGDVRLDDVPAPSPPRVGEVLLEVVLCGVCGTDFEEFRHGPIGIPVAEAHPLTGRRAPMTLGHEVLGRVVEVGAGVSGVEVGDRVVPDGLFFCGECPSCRRGQQTLCTKLASIGQQQDGGMAEFLAVPAAMCVRIGPTVPDRQAVLVEPLSVAVRAIRRARLGGSDRVLIIGAGAIGQCVASLAVRAAAEVALVDSDPDRLAATRAALPQLTEADPDGSSVAECVFDCAGSEASFESALRMAVPGGRVVLVGVARAAPNFSPLALALKELTIITSLSHDRVLDTTVAADLLEAGELSLGHVVTDIIGIDEAVDEVFTDHGPAPTLRLKIAVDPSRSGA